MSTQIPIRLPSTPEAVERDLEYLASAIDAVPVGGGGGGLTLIQEIIATAAQTRIEFAGIPATYRTLVLEWVARDTIPGFSATVSINLNSDYGSNYQREYAQVIGTGQTSANVTDASIAAGTIPGANTTGTGAASMAGYGRLVLPQYKNTNWNKPWYMVGGFATISTGHLERAIGAWVNTAAINDIQVNSAFGFSLNSVFTLYGQS